MPLKEIAAFDHGLTWVMEEWMQRASHAVVSGGKVWLIDPVDEPEPLAQAEALGEIAGVIQLLDRHPRACKALARRYDVPLHYLPAAGPLEGTPFEVVQLIEKKGWRERALWWPGARTLIVAELVGTNHYYALSGKLGVHLMLRATRVTVGEDLPVEHLLMGHGAPLHDDVPAQLAQAYKRRKRDLVLLPKALRAFVGKQ